MNEEGLDIDYFPVGNGEKSGDAIALRVGKLHSNNPDDKFVVVIDGGFKDSVEEQIEHIRGHYKTNTVNLVIATHPDQDHVSGLHVLVEEMDVKFLMMHMPWGHEVGSSQKAKKSYEQAVTLAEIAEKNGVKIIEPFAGGAIDLTTSSTLQILGPGLPYYKELLSEFEFNKDFATQLAETIKKAATTIKEATRKIRETLDPSSETLDHVHKDTSAENRSSVIAYFNVGGKGLLFTGDAGVDSLHRAADYAESHGIDLKGLRFFDVPHHGSKHNIDSKFLDRISGTSAFISAAKKSDKHPSPRVKNALVRREFNVFTNEDGTIHHHYNAPDRPSWSALTPHKLVMEFSEDE